MDLVIGTVGDDPALAARLDDLPGAWPEFMLHHPLSALFYDLAATAYADFCLVAIDPAEPRRAVARAYSVPLHWAGAPPAHWTDPAVEMLEGHDEVILRGERDRRAGRGANLVAALEIAVRPDRRGAGVSGLLLDAMRRNCARLGFSSLVAPVRPSHKHHHPDLPMAEYAARTGADGLPADPWLRVHRRAGGVIGAVAPCSMTLTATLARWREWTGLPFDTTGPVLVPEALVPVHCDLTHDHAVYVEPNVWVHHSL